jgi:hypothetical protein
MSLLGQVFNPLQIMPNGIKNFFNGKVAASSKLQIWSVNYTGVSKSFLFLHIFNNFNADIDFSAGINVHVFTLDSLGVLSDRGDNTAAVLASSGAPNGVSYNIATPGLIKVYADNLSLASDSYFNIQSVMIETDLVL